MPTISVITPAYNAANTIQETVASVLRQTFTDFELIVIDDGSTDETLSIVQRLDDPRVRVFSFSNSGPQKSRNRGIERASGHYLTFLDADDLWARDKLACQLEALQQTPQAAVAYSWTDVIDETSQVIQSGRRATANGDVFEALLEENFLGSGSNPLIRAEALTTVDGFDEAIVAGQDWDMWLTLAARYAFVGVPKVQIFYRKASSVQSWSSQLRRQEKGLSQVMAKHLAKRPALTISKPACWANCYRYLLFECFQKCPPSPSNGVLALQYFARAIALDPRWWSQRAHLVLVVLMKSTAYLFSFMPRSKRRVASKITREHI